MVGPPGSGPSHEHQHEVKGAVTIQVSKAGSRGINGIVLVRELRQGDIPEDSPIAPGDACQPGADRTPAQSGRRATRHERATVPHENVGRTVWFDDASEKPVDRREPIRLKPQRQRSCRPESAGRSGRKGPGAARSPRA